MNTIKFAVYVANSDDYNVQKIGDCLDSETSFQIIGLNRIKPGLKN